jgi:hypothetical protein
MLLPSLIRDHCMSPNALDKATAVNVASRPCKIRRMAIAEATSMLNIVCKLFVALFVNWLENAALAYHAVSSIGSDKLDKRTIDNCTNLSIIALIYQ